MTIETEVQSLRQVSMFREIDPAKLKLLAFTSDRLSYEQGDVLFRQHEISDSTYVIVEGKVDVWLEAREPGRERIKVAELGAGAIVGEMGVLGVQVFDWMAQPLANAGVPSPQRPKKPTYGTKFDETSVTPGSHRSSG